MFDIGWSEMAIIAVVALVVLGPKELPHALKTFSHWMRTARKLGSEFQSGVNEIVREAELDDAKRELQKLSQHSISQKIEKAIDPAGDLKKAMNEPVEETKSALSAAPDMSAALPPFPGLPKVEAPSPEAPSLPASSAPANETAPAAIADAAPVDQNKSDKSISA